MSVNIVFRRTVTIAFILLGVMSLPVTAPRFICSASMSGIWKESAMVLVMSDEPVGKTLSDTGMSLSKIMMESVSAPMLARTTPAVFWALVRVTRLAASDEAMTPSTSTPAASTASTSSS